MTDLALLAPTAFIGGALLGAAWLGFIERSVAALANGKSLARVVLFAFVRLGLAAVAFWVAALQGALPLLLALAGFATARLLLLARIKARLQ
jgi:N-ATPase, AtpR subunit